MPKKNKYQGYRGHGRRICSSHGGRGIGVNNNSYNNTSSPLPPGTGESHEHIQLRLKTTGVDNAYYGNYTNVPILTGRHSLCTIKKGSRK